MNKIYNITKDEDGFVLILALMVLLILTIVGIAANRTTTTEMLISGNDSHQKKTFYAADGGTEIAAEVLEENIACISGFQVNSGSDSLLEGLVLVDSASLNFWQNEAPPDVPADGDRDFFWPDGYASGEPHTNVRVGGRAEMTTGAALQAAAAYEGKGKAIGSGGVNLSYDIYAQRLEVNNAEAIVHVEWLHVVGQEGDCLY